MTSVSAELREARQVLRQRLIEAGHLIACDVPGVYGRGGDFEGVIEAFERLVTRCGQEVATVPDSFSEVGVTAEVGPPPEVMRFPPVMSRANYRQTDHAEAMPHLMGSVHSFMGNDLDWVELTRKLQAGEAWTDALQPSQVMLVPAACYPLYPALRGTLPQGGRTIDLRTFVFRHEPSDDPARMQSFRQREYVRLGSAEQARAHRDGWLKRGLSLLASLGVEAQAVVANDPFFGRGGRVMKATQREQALKYEIVVPITSQKHPTAVISSNCHLDHFGQSFDIRAASGQPAHTACVGFGLERVALALFKVHGMQLEQWPRAVRKALGLEAQSGETNRGESAQASAVAASTISGEFA